MSDQLIGLLGVVGLFAFAFTWSWIEERLRARQQRKYDKRMAKYDTWSKKIDSI